MSWKDSPGIIAVVSGSAVTVFVVTIFFTVVIPTWLKSKDFEIEQLNRKIGGIEKVVEQKSRKLSEQNAYLKKNESAYEQEVQRLKRNIHELEESNRRLSLENIFSVEDVYPKGYRMVRIFDPISRISEVYKEKEIEKLDSWVSVYTNDYHVDQVVYYYTKYKGEEVITHILFLVPEENLSKEVIYEQLVEKYGFGNAELIDKDKIKIWRFNDVLKHNLEVGDGSYVISPVLLGN